MELVRSEQNGILTKLGSGRSAFELPVRAYGPKLWLRQSTMSTDIPTGMRFTRSSTVNLCPIRTLSLRLMINDLHAEEVVVREPTTKHFDCGL